MDISTGPGHVDHVDDFDYELDGQVPKDDLDFGIDGGEYMPTSLDDDGGNNGTGEDVGEQARDEKDIEVLPSHDPSVTEDYADDWQQGFETRKDSDAIDEIDYDDDEAYGIEPQSRNQSTNDSHVPSQMADLHSHELHQGRSAPPGDGPDEETVEADLDVSHEENQEPMVTNVLGGDNDEHLLENDGGNLDVSAADDFGNEGQDDRQDQALLGFSNQPDVKVIYRNAEYSLFAESPDDDPDSYFFVDTEACNVSLTKFLFDVRQVIANEVAQRDELIMRIDGLGLEVGETTTPDLLELTTFRQLLSIHDRLVKNDDPAASQTLYVHLATRPNCLRRFACLIDGVGRGRGLAELGSYFDTRSGQDTSPFEQQWLEESQDEPTDNVDDDDDETSLDQAVDVDAGQLAEAGQDPFATATAGQLAQEVAEEISQALQPIEDDDTQQHEMLNMLAPEVGENHDFQSQQEGAFIENYIQVGVEVVGDVDKAAPEHDEVQQMTEEAEYLDDAGVQHHDPDEELDTTQEQASHALNGNTHLFYQEDVAVDGDNGYNNFFLATEDFDTDLVSYKDTSMAESELETGAASYDDQTLADSHKESANVDANDDLYLDLHEHEELTEAQEVANATQTQANASGQGSTPLPPSANTSATATLNGDEAHNENGDAANSSVVNAQQTLEGLQEPGPTLGESGVNEIDWGNDDDEDEVVAQHDTNLPSPSLSTKRSRQTESDGVNDENAIKRRRT